jgi:general secretion pathway protein L
MPILNARIDLDYARFFAWWGGELVALLPERVREILWPRRARLELACHGEDLEAEFIETDERRPLGRLGLGEGGAGERDKLFEQHPALLDAELRLRLSPGQCLVRTLKLPAAAAENLQQVMAFEMDRLTPFKASQVYYSARIVERLPDTRQIRVELALTPRLKLDPLLDELAAAGWRPGMVVVDGEAGEHDLLPEKYRGPRSMLPHRLTVAFSVLFGLLLLATLALPVWLNRGLEQTLQREVKQVAKVAKEVEALKSEAERLTHESGFLLRRKRLEPATVEMLDELSRAIPDQTWLNGLQFRDHKIVMQGQSPAASSLIERIEASPVFKNTSFVSPVTKDIASGQERFQIATEVAGEKSPEQQPVQPESE